MAKKKPGRFITQATQDALVRFGPEISGLKALIQQAQEERSTGINAARTTAQAITNAVDQARPQVTKVYNTAAATQSRVSDQVVGDIAHLTGVNPNIVAAMAVERAASSDRTSTGRADTLSDLSRQRVAAQRGKQFGIQSANREFSSAVSKVLQRQVDLANEQGAFIASQTSKARQAAAERRQAMRKVKLQLTQQERASLRSSGVDPDTGKLTKNAKIKVESIKAQQQKDEQRQKKPTQGDRSAVANFGKALTWAGRLSTSKGAQSKTKQQIRRGAVEVLTTGDRDNGIPAIPQPLARAAVEMKVDGYVSQSTIKMLRKQGYRVDLFPGIRTKPPKNPPKVGKQPPGPGIFGQIIDKLG